MSIQWPDMSRLKKLASELKFDEDMTRLGENVEVLQNENYREKYSAAITACPLEVCYQLFRLLPYRYQQSIVTE